MLAVAFVSVGVVVAALATVPVQHSFSWTPTSGFLSNNATDLTFPGGVHVTGSWHVGNGRTVWLTIYPPQGSLVYSANGSSGSFSFTATAVTYEFSVSSNLSATTTLNGGYSAPYL